MTVKLLRAYLKAAKESVKKTSAGRRWAHDKAADFETGRARAFRKSRRGERKKRPKKEASLTGKKNRKWEKLMNVSEGTDASGAWTKASKKATKREQGIRRAEIKSGDPVAKIRREREADKIRHYDKVMKMRKRTGG